MPHPRHQLDRWPQRLEGSAVRAVDAYGKHLFLRFDSGLTVHSHLRMSGAWDVYRQGQRRRRARRRAWLVLRCDGFEVVEFDGPVLELASDARIRSDPRLVALGPDVLGEHFEERSFLARLRADDPRRPIGDALLEQRTVAGIGNVWKAEALLRGRGRSLACAGRRERQGGARAGGLRARAHARLRASRTQRAPARRVQARGSAVRALRRSDPRSRARRRQPCDLLVSRLPALSATPARGASLLTGARRVSRSPGDSAAYAHTSAASSSPALTSASRLRACTISCRSRTRASNASSAFSPVTAYAGTPL